MTSVAKVEASGAVPALGDDVVHDGTRRSRTRQRSPKPHTPRGSCERQPQPRRAKKCRFQMPEHNPSYERGAIVIKLFKTLADTARLPKFRAPLELDKAATILQNQRYSYGTTPVRNASPESRGTRIHTDSPDVNTAQPTGEHNNHGRNTNQESIGLPVSNPAVDIVFTPTPADPQSTTHQARSNTLVMPISDMNSAGILSLAVPLHRAHLDNTMPKCMLRNLSAQLVHSERTEPNLQLPVSRTMTASEVISRLVDHGCRDITRELDATSSSSYPLSSGGFGDVYRAKLRDGTAVAIKTMRLRIDYMNEGTDYLKDAARELHTWSKCDHPNVIKLLGLTKFRGRIGMVSSWMEHGNLPAYLSRNPRADRHRISIQISEGLSYLHSRGIVHGDLKGINVLVSAAHTVMLTDFGNSTLRDRTMSFTGTVPSGVVSPRWAAPELLRGQSTQCMETDIYALGMTILETLAGKVPFSEKVDQAVYTAVLLGWEIPMRPDIMPRGNESSDALWELLESCWQRDPRDRPRADTVEDKIKSIKWSPFWQII